MNKERIVFVLCVCVVLMAGASTGAYLVTDPTDIWVGGVEANGKDIVDPAGGTGISKDYGTYSSSQFNSNPDRYVFGMDTSEFLTGAGNIPGSIVLTQAVSDVDLTVTMGTGVQFLMTSPTESSSTSNALAMSNFSFRNLVFDRPVDAAGFCITRIGQPNLTVSFYSDAAGTALLASYTILNDTDASVPARYTGFVGHTDTNVGIRNISAVRGTSSGSATLIDDIAVVVPEPTTLVLIGIGALGMHRRRRRG